MSDEIIQILKSHGEQLASQSEELKSHGGQLKSQSEQLKSQSEQLKSQSEQLKSQSEQLASHGEELKSHGQQIDFIVKKVLEHDDRLQRIEDNMATKADINDISDTLDKLVVLAQKKDQELAMMSHAIRRVDDKVEQMAGRS